MDTHRFARLVRRFPDAPRRGVLAALPVLALDTWQNGNGQLDAEAGSCKPKGRKKFNKKGYAICHAGETQIVGAKQRCLLMKKGATDGACEAPVP